MGKEIERKYLVTDDGWGPADDGAFQRQGYIAITDLGTVRIRIEDGVAILNVKGAQKGLTRAEYEYPIPVDDAEELLTTLCGLVIEKTRYKREFGGRTWEIDVFHGVNEGLVTAEVELADETDEIDLPDWVGEDVSLDHRYRVAHLSRHPFLDWNESG